MAERTIAASDTLVRKAPLYGVIFADPPWRFEPYSRITGMDRAADNHYPTMTTDEDQGAAGSGRTGLRAVPVCEAAMLPRHSM